MIDISQIGKVLHQLQLLPRWANNYMNFGPQTEKVIGAHIYPPYVHVQCKLTQFHSPRGSRVRFSESFTSCHCSERNFEYL